ncbi:MAG: universal stress protein [Gemmatimonadales bacterium]
MERITRILAATDGSEVGEHAVAMAEALVRAGQAKLEVLGVETAGLPAYAGIGEWVQRGGPRTRPITLARGIPGVEIVRRAGEIHADLVVLGRRERSGAFLAPGRTTDLVVRRHMGPCLMIPPNVRDVRRVLIALDGTQRGLGILESAAAIAELAEAQSESVCVSNDGLRPVADGVPRILAALVHHPGLGGPDSLQIRHGSPVREILAELAERGFDLLAIGVRRGGPPGEMGSGHVGQDLLREAPVAILTVPI